MCFAQHLTCALASTHTQVVYFVQSTFPAFSVDFYSLCLCIFLFSFMSLLLCHLLSCSHYQGFLTSYWVPTVAILRMISPAGVRVRVRINFNSNYDPSWINDPISKGKHPYSKLPHLSTSA